MSRHPSITNLDALVELERFVSNYNTCPWDVVSTCLGITNDELFQLAGNLQELIKTTLDDLTYGITTVSTGSLQGDCQRIAGLMMYAFHWAETPQGDDYWCTWHNRFTSIAEGTVINEHQVREEPTEFPEFIV